MPLYVEVQLDKPRRLRFDVNALADLEEKMGVSFAMLLHPSRAGFSSYRGLIWAGLKWEDRGLTLERAGNMLQTYFANGGTEDQLTEWIDKALVAAKIIKDTSKDDTEGNAKTEAAM